ncbi:hypothetical protein HY633_05275 [Candidatus Uhrbacteria bacterium]|nr:hypothetical protein [Candidatus Uhrbacteria bacterium]
MSWYTPEDWPPRVSPGVTYKHFSLKVLPMLNIPPDIGREVRACIKCQDRVASLKLKATTFFSTVIAPQVAVLRQEGLICRMADCMADARFVCSKCGGRICFAHSVDCPQCKRAFCHLTTETRGEDVDESYQVYYRKVIGGCGEKHRHLLGLINPWSP